MENVTFQMENTTFKNYLQNHYLQKSDMHTYELGKM